MKLEKWIAKNTLQQTLKAKDETKCGLWKGENTHTK